MVLYTKKKYNHVIDSLYMEAKDETQDNTEALVNLSERELLQKKAHR